MVCTPEPIRLFYFMEVWKDIPGYEGLYKASNHGRIKSLERLREQPKGGIRVYPEKILLLKNTTGYLRAELCKNGIRKIYSVHRLVWESFNGKTDLQIDHIIEGNKTFNWLCNLQTLTPRQNTIKHKLTTKKTSQYTGVSWHKQSKKWVAQIRLNRKTVNLGYYNNEYDAHLAYQSKFSE